MGSKPRTAARFPRYRPHLSGWGTSSRPCRSLHQALVGDINRCPEEGISLAYRALLIKRVKNAMSASGTDKTKSGFELTGPVVILVEPQLGENIGMAARAMGNFALTRLRIVNPRDGWPNVSAQRAPAGADHILDRVELFDTVQQAVADCTLLFATTARAHDQAKPVVAPEAAATEMAGQIKAGGTVGILFGRERYGLQNEEVGLANRIITFPVNPGFASLNLAQAVLLIGYEWFKLATAGALPFAMPERSEPSSQHQMQAFFDNLVRELDKVEFLRPAEKRETMLVNLRNIFSRMEPTKQD